MHTLDSDAEQLANVTFLRFITNTAADSQQQSSGRKELELQERQGVEKAPAIVNAVTMDGVKGA